LKKIPITFQKQKNASIKKQSADQLKISAL